MITKDSIQLDNPCMEIVDEVFVPIRGFEQYYQISNYGNVKSFHRRECGEYLKFGGVRKDGKGYRSIMLYGDEKHESRLVHKMVAEAFIPNPSNKPTVNHKDGNRCNNYVYNLEWATYAENNQHALDCGLRAVRSGASNTLISAVRSPVAVMETGEVFETCVSCDKHFGKSEGYISSVIRRSKGFSSELNLHFMYLTNIEYEALMMGNLVLRTFNFKNADYLNKGVHHRSMCVRVTETNECFASASECDAKYGLSLGTISDVIRRSNGYYGKADIHVERITPEEYLAWKANPVITPHKPNLREQIYLKVCHGGFCVKIIDTGECFATAKDCDIHKGYSEGFTARIISKYGGYRKTSSPYHFTKITLEEYIAYVQSQSNL